MGNVLEKSVQIGFFDPDIADGSAWSSKTRRSFCSGRRLEAWALFFRGCKGGLSGGRGEISGNCRLWLLRIQRPGEWEWPWNFPDQHTQLSASSVQRAEVAVVWVSGSSATRCKALRNFSALTGLMRYHSHPSWKEGTMSSGASRTVTMSTLAFL